MKVKILLSVLCIAVVLMGSSFFVNMKNSSADEEISSASIASKLDALANGQKVILQKLEEIKSELAVIKVRASQR